MVDSASEPTITAVVVEDDPDQRTLIRLTFELAGNVTVVGEAADLSSGVEQVGRLAPDVVVLDVHLAATSGLELIQALRADGYTGRLVAYTADDRALRPAVEVGADIALLKAGDLAPLIAAVVGSAGRREPG